MGNTPIRNADEYQRTVWWSREFGSAIRELEQTDPDDRIRALQIGSMASMKETLDAQIAEWKAAHPEAE